MGAGQVEGHTESECTSMPEGWPTKHDTRHTDQGGCFTRKVPQTP